MKIGDIYLPKTNYRSANVIIQTMLEGLLRRELTHPYFRAGVVKSHLIRFSGLKTAVAEKYLAQMEKAGYLTSNIDHWGEREIIILEITEKGKERYQWFVQINTELSSQEDL